MSNVYVPFRYDYVGSFLRPAELKETEEILGEVTTESTQYSRDELTIVPFPDADLCISP